MGTLFRDPVSENRKYAFQAWGENSGFSIYIRWKKKV